jgi:hypothetical protein
VGVQHAVVEASLYPLDLVALVVGRTADRALAVGVFEDDQREDHSRLRGAIDLVRVEGRLGGECFQLLELVAGDEHVETLPVVDHCDVAGMEFED